MTKSTDYLIIALAVVAIALIGVFAFAPSFMSTKAAGAIGLGLWVAAYLIIVGLVIQSPDSIFLTSGLVIKMSVALMAIPAYYLDKMLGVPPVCILVPVGVILGMVYILPDIKPLTGPYKAYDACLNQIARGGAAGVITQLESRANLSIDELVNLSRAYLWQGSGEQAEAYARRALAPAPLKSKVKHVLYGHTVKSDRVIALAQALAIQGRYAEAISTVSQLDNPPKTPAMNSLYQAVWALCAGDEDQARRLVEPIPGVFTSPGLPNSATPNYQFMYYYMQYRLLGKDTRPNLRKMPDLLAQWEAEAARNAHNPYGARLRDILADIREVME